MIVFVVLLAIMTLVYGLPILAGRREWRQTEHARCLVRIEALEREIYGEARHVQGKP